MSNNKKFYLLAAFFISFSLIMKAQDKKRNGLEELEVNSKIEKTFNKNSTDYELKQISDYFLAEFNAKVEFTDIKRNENDEIIAITTKTASNNFSSSSTLMTPQGIGDMKVIYDVNSKNISTSSANMSTSLSFNGFGESFQNKFPLNEFKNLEDINPEDFLQRFQLDSLDGNSFSFNFNDEIFKDLREKFNNGEGLDFMQLDGKSFDFDQLLNQNEIKNGILSLEDFMKQKMNPEAKNEDLATKKEVEALKKELEATKAELEKLKEKKKK